MITEDEAPAQQRRFPLRKRGTGVKTLSLTVYAPENPKRKGKSTFPYKTRRQSEAPRPEVLVLPSLVKSKKAKVNPLVMIYELKFF